MCDSVFVLVCSNPFLVEVYEDLSSASDRLGVLAFKYTCNKGNIYFLTNEKNERVYCKFDVTPQESAQIVIFERNLDWETESFKVNAVGVPAERTTKNAKNYVTNVLAELECGQVSALKKELAEAKQKIADMEEFHEEAAQKLVGIRGSWNKLRAERETRYYSRV